MEPARSIDLATRPASRRGQADALQNARSACTTLSIELAENEPPKEFCIFTAGQVVTTKGTFTFDDAAAKSVMAEYEAHGIDLMIDYDHASLADVTLDPAQTGKAAGWFNLELRNGELWAVNVRWTPPAEASLRAKEWRFMSPAFSTDGEKRVTSLLNVAITNLPATRRLEPLMAAGARKTPIMASADSGLSPKLISAALEAVASKDAKTSLDLMKQILAALLGGSSEDAPPPVGDGGADDATEPPPAAMAADPEEKKDAMAAAARVAIALTGKTDPGEAMAELVRRSKVAVDLESREATLAADRQTLEASERRALVGSLVKLGVEIPATAWSDDKGTVPCARLTSEPLADLRKRVATLSAAGVRPGSAPRPPGSADAIEGLSAREIAMCAEKKIDPKDYAARKSAKKD